MGGKRIRPLNDCAHLKLSRERGERLRGLVIAKGIRETEWHPWSMRCVIPESEPEETPFTYDPSDPSKLWLRRLTGSPILTWPITLPPRDARGILNAEKFECWKTASDSKIGIAGYHYSFKGGGQVACHSALEARMLAYFEMCPFVVEIRTQYPMWDKDAFLEYCRRGERMFRRELYTIDFMLTLKLPELPYRIYHGVSGKPEAYLELPSVQKRHAKEARDQWQWGSTHEVMTERTISDIEFESYQRMFENMKHAKPKEIGALAGAAENFAAALRASTAQGNAGRVVPMVGKRFGWDRAQSFRLLSIALFLGYLRWDVGYLFVSQEPLRFVR